MLVHIDQPEVAERVHNAWLRTIEDGIHTYDIFTQGVSTQKVGTKEFARAVVERLGQKPCQLKPVAYARGHEPAAEPPPPAVSPPSRRSNWSGVDVYVEWPSRDSRRLAAVLQRLDGGPMTLTMISNRGLKVWPGGQPETFCTDAFRCRFAAPAGVVTHAHIVGLLGRIAGAGIEIAMTENLRLFDGQPGYSLAQGE